MPFYNASCVFSASLQGALGGIATSLQFALQHPFGVATAGKILFAQHVRGLLKQRYGKAQKGRHMERNN
jgi:hypothetical protein